MSSRSLPARLQLSLLGLALVLIGPPLPASPQLATERPVAEAPTRFSEAEVLEPPARGEEIPDPLLHPERENTTWADAFTVVFADPVEIPSGGSERIDFEVTEPGYIYLFVRATTTSLRQLSVAVVHTGTESPAWSLAESEVTGVPPFAKGRIEVDERWLERGLEWALVLSNQGPQDTTVELWLGTVPQLDREE